VLRMRALLFPVSAVVLVLCGWAAFALKDSEAAGAADRASAAEQARTAVIRQLEALQENDEPSPDAGIKTAWDYAHPSNQSATGPLDRFTRMLKSPAYRD